MKKFLLIITIFILGNTAFCADFHIYKLDNGHTIITKNVPDNPIVTIDTWVNTGSINEDINNKGVSHFLEHLMFKGTNTYPTGTADRLLESKGGIINAATGNDFTHFFITIPSSSFELAMKIHADILINPLIPRKELEKERKVVLEEISIGEDSPQSKVFTNLCKNLYSTLPYKDKVIGTKNVIEIISREEILDYFNKFYTPQNMTTIIVGDIADEKAFSIAKKYFAINNKKNYKSPKIKPDSKNSTQILTQAKDKIENAYMLIGFRTIPAKCKKESATLDVLATILGDGKSSRLYNDIYNQKHLAFSIGASHISFKHDGIFYINAEFLPQNFEKLNSDIFNEILNFKTEKVSQNELSKAKNIIERDIQFSRESNANQASEIGYYKVIYDDENYYNNYINDIKSDSAEDIMNVAKKYLNKNNSVVSVLYPEKFENSFNKKNDIKKEIPKEIQKTTKATEYQLSNGLKLILSPNKSNDIVAISILSKGGYFLENKAGISNILSAALFKGTTNYSMQEFNKTLEENGIALNVSPSADYFKITLKTTKKNLPIAINLLKELANEAKLEPFYIEQIKINKLNSIKNVQDNPFNIAIETLKGEIWENTPYGNSIFNLEKSIPSITQEDVKNYYKNIFEPQNIIISVNGDVDNQKIISDFSDVFNQKNNKKINLNAYKNLFLNSPQKQDIELQKQDINVAWLTLGYRVSGSDNIKDYATLNLIDSILGSGMSSRLFSDLREQNGLAYSVGSSYVSNLNDGLFVFYIGTNPKSIQQAKSGIFKNIETIKREFVSNKELENAKEKIKGNYSILLETNMAKASSYAQNELMNQDLNFMEKYFKIIDSITPNDIIEVSNKYFTNNNYVFVTISK